VAVFLVRLALGTLQVASIIRRASRRDGNLLSDRCGAPVTAGWFRPVVILPESWSRWPGAQLDAVLTHEREHARRRDPLFQWIALLNRSVFWFHPLAWWLERRLAALAEEACDAAVLARGYDPHDYSGYLIEMARSAAGSGARVQVWGLAMPGRFLEECIRRIVQASAHPRLSRARWVGMILACTATSVIVGAGEVERRLVPPAAEGKPITMPDLPARQDAESKLVQVERPATRRAPGAVSGAGAGEEEWRQWVPCGRRGSRRHRRRWSSLVSRRCCAV
jgi:hypothetical protein